MPFHLVFLWCYGLAFCFVGDWCGVHAQLVLENNEKSFFRGANIDVLSDEQPFPETREVPWASMTVPLHSHSGTHHLFVFLGSPDPQRQTLILDTGSRYMAFPCDPWCKRCGKHHSRTFNITKSTTLRKNEAPNCIFSGDNPQPRSVRKKKKMQEKDQSCVFHQKYLEGSSWTAMEFEDFLWLGTWDQQETIEEYMPYLAIPFTFGCQTSVTGHFAKQYANGILGMARSLDENAFLNAMVKSNAIERAAFATCLTRMGGTLSLGGSGLARNDGGARQYHLEPMTFTNIIQDHGLYSLKVNKVLVGDFCITCAEDATNDKERIARRATLLAFRAGKGVLLDSGTTDTFLPKQAHRGLGKAWRAATGLSMQETRVYTYGQFRSMPDIRMVFHPNTTIVIPPSSYMDGVPRDLNATTLEEEVKRWAGSRKLTMRVYCEEPKGAVLGANAMYHYDVLYDLQDKRIGLARSFCGNQ